MPASSTTGTVRRLYLSKISATSRSLVPSPQAMTRSTLSFCICTPWSTSISRASGTTPTSFNLVSSYSRVGGTPTIGSITVTTANYSLYSSTQTGILAAVNPSGGDRPYPSVSLGGAVTGRSPIIDAGDSSTGADVLYAADLTERIEQVKQVRLSQARLRFFHNA